MTSWATRRFLQGLGAFGSTLFFYKYHSYVGTVVYCEGISMEPTVNDGDYLLVERLSIKSGHINKGDIVVAGQPRHPCHFCHVLKRITALGNDNVTYWDETRWCITTRKVPTNHVWLEGDNGVHSLDSRSYGPVPVSNLEYRVLLRLWPLSRFGRLKPLLSVEAPRTPSSVTKRDSSNTFDSCSDRSYIDNPSRS